MSEKKKRDIDATREALLRAAKELMTGCADCDEVTSRKIAAKAEVNAAMINYCFGSREELLYEVFRGLLNDALRVRPQLAEMMSKRGDPKEKLFFLHYNMMKLMIENFGIARAITKYILLSRTADVGMESLPLIREFFGIHRSEEECRVIAFELTSLHELAVLRHEEMKLSFGLDLTDDVKLARFVRQNVDRFLNIRE